MSVDLSLKILFNMLLLFGSNLNLKVLQASNDPWGMNSTLEGNIRCEKGGLRNGICSGRKWGYQIVLQDETRVFGRLDGQC